MSFGFIRISRELLDHPAYDSAPDSHKNVLMVLMFRACYKETVIDDHGKKIILRAGQLCCTIRQLAKWCNLPTTTVVRALGRYEAVKITEQKVEHTKSVFSISERYLLQDTGTTFGTKTVQERNTKEESKKAITKTTPTSPKKEKGGGGGFYDCLKEIEIPEHRKIQISQDYPQIRVELAVKYILHEDFVPNKGIIQAIIWHCKKINPPEHAEKPKVEWEKLAHKHNEIYKEKRPKAFEKNKELIKEQSMRIWQVDCFVPISLGNSIEVLKKDFDQAVKEYKITLKNLQNSQEKILTMEKFA